MANSADTTRPPARSAAPRSAGPQSRPWTDASASRQSYSGSWGRSGSERQSWPPCPTSRQRQKFPIGPAKASLRFTGAGSARAAFILQGVDDLPRQGAHDAVNSQIEILLQFFDCRFGPNAEAPVNATSIETDCAHPALQAADGQAGRARLQHGMALVSFVDVDPRHSANHSIDWDFPRLLKLLDRGLSLRTEDTIDRPGVVSQSLQSLLQVSNSRVIRSLLQHRFCHHVPPC